MNPNRTKILATIGPSCSRLDILQSMIDLGVNAFRINLSHGDRQSKLALIRLLKQVKAPSGVHPCILADLAGPKIRVAEVLPDFELKQGQKVRITSEHSQDKETIVITKGFSFGDVEIGARILMNDGRIQLEVIEVESRFTVLCQTMIGGEVVAGRGLNFPGIRIQGPSLTKQDGEDLELALEEGVDWIALSFVRSPADREVVDSILRKKNYKDPAGGSFPVIAKIEKWEALNQLDAILEAFDGVMVARGDLGVEIPLEQVPLIQKKIIRKANMLGKPVIIATQLLESMIASPTPTRAEVSDIANAIFDGADALLVTGETAIGRYPQKVIQVLMEVILESEKHLPYHSLQPETGKPLHIAQAISHATCEVARDLGIPYIVSMTHTGSTARMISRYRPIARILALTPFQETTRRLAVVWGVTPFIVAQYTNIDDIPNILQSLVESKQIVKTGERYVVSGGVPVGVPGTTNYLWVKSI